MNRAAALMALVAAALFGASAPVAKRLLAEVAPSLLAALLYAGAGLMALPFAARAWKRREATLRANDLPLLAVVIAGCALSTWAAGGATATLLGPVAVAAACACWAIDNNLTQRLSLKDPLAVVCVKGLGAAPIAYAVARVQAHAAWPPGRFVGGALALGAVSYGLSLMLYVRAMR